MSFRTADTHEAGSSRRRAQLWQVLDNPVLWEATRLGLDISLGLYRRRIDLLTRWRILENGASLLDIGCGIGHYAKLAPSEYLGIDLNRRFIEYARRRHKASRHSFRWIDVRDLRAEGRRFDVVLLVDFLHHLDDASCRALLETAGALAKRALVSFEPITAQSNPLGRWIIEHDRGNHIRPLVELRALFDRVPSLSVRDSVELALGPITTQAILCMPVANDGP